MAVKVIDLPIIDVSSFLDGKGTEEEVKGIGSALVDSYTRFGFVYVKGWEVLVPKEDVARMFEENERFFKLPQGKKDALAYTSAEANRGYLAVGRENGAIDRKETFEIGNGITPKFPEHWPNEADLPGFKDFTSEFHIKANDLYLAMMQLLAVALGLEKDFFRSQINKRPNNLRMLHYPPVSRAVPSDILLNSHTDDGTITLLWQDDTGGLEVLSPEGEWLPAVPIKDTLLINVADILQRWSNDVLKSTRHRAVLPLLREGEDPAGWTKTRRSIAYFGNPNGDAKIECIPVFGEPKYEPVIAAEFYANRLRYNISSS